MREALLPFAVAFLIVFGMMAAYRNLGGRGTKVRVEEDLFTCERFRLPDGYRRTGGSISVKNGTAVVTFVFEKDQETK